MTNNDLRPEDDPTLMRNQPALQTSKGGIWLGIGAVLTAIVLGVLIPLTAIDAVVTGVGIAVVVLLFVALVVTRVVTSQGRRRLIWMAVFFSGIAFAGLVTVFIVSSIQAETLG